MKAFGEYRRWPAPSRTVPRQRTAAGNGRIFAPARTVKPARRRPRAGCRNQTAPTNSSFTFVKMVTSAEPRRRRATIAATYTSAAIRPYSIMVAPDSSVKNAFTISLHS